jgi:hypothetical protein
MFFFRHPVVLQIRSLHHLGLDVRGPGDQPHAALDVSQFPSKKPEGDGGPKEGEGDDCRNGVSLQQLALLQKYKCTGPYPG